MEGGRGRRDLEIVEEIRGSHRMLPTGSIAFTTILGWSSYAEKCAVYLFGLNCRIYFRIVFILFVASYILIVMYVDMNNISDRTAINSVWVVSDIANGLMAFPNLIALFMLRKVVVSETVDYFRNFLPKAKRQ